MGKSTAWITPAAFSLGVLVAICALSCGVASAEPPPVRSVITYSELDLATDASVRTLYSRIERVAANVCFRETSRRPGIDQQARYAVCYDDVVSRVAEQLGQARLAALHRSESRLASRVNE